MHSSFKALPTFLAWLPAKRARRFIGMALFALALSPKTDALAGSLNLSQSPLFLTSGQAPLVMLTMARDHKLYYEAYNDYSDLDGDGSLDVGYKPDKIDYYGYFDSHKCYNYDTTNGLFVPASVTANKKCSGQWSGDFLNYVTTSRMDAIRKVLYGGYRSTDTASNTVLERAFVPQDAHSWGKEYQSVERDGYDISDYTTLSLPAAGTYHLFANTTLSSGGAPVMRVLTNTTFRVWEWLSIERPVAGTKCATGNNFRSNCVDGWEVVPSSAFSNLTQSFYDTSGYSPGSPSSASAYDDLVSNYAVSNKLCGTQTAAQINGQGNPFAGKNGCNSNSDYYLDLFQGNITVPASGTYNFAVDGDDAVELWIDGSKLVGWYGGHGNCSCTSNSASVTLTAGSHTIVFRHQENTGGDNYYLYWQYVPSTPATMTDYNTRVQVCNAAVGLESNCEAYGSSSKPVGLLQKQGENNGMYFGLITGSYRHNTEGGVVRKIVSSINNEIMSTGQFGTTSQTCQSGTTCVNGIISTLNNLKITGFRYPADVTDHNNDYTYSCGWIDNRQMTDGECEMWGNPVGEMLYEGLRYFSGKSGPTSAFSYSSTDSSITDNQLGLPEITTWTNPYSSSPSPAAATPTFSACSKPYSLLISDVYPSFDSNSLPGSKFNSFSGDITDLDVGTLGDTIWKKELGESQNIFIGQVGSTKDGAPTAKTASSFGNIRGLTPSEPSREGSYYSASVAYYAHTHKMNNLTGSQKMNTYSVALAPPLPKIEIPVGTGKISFLPFAKSVGGTVKGYNLSPNTTGTDPVTNKPYFQPTNQIVDFYIDTIRNVSGSPSDPSINGGRAYYKFRINYEDSEQGADHDMDAVGMYEILLNADNTVSIRVSSDYAAGSIIQHMGFVVSGTTNDGAYLVVRDSDTDASSDVVYLLDCRSSSTSPSLCVGVNGSGALPLFKELKFSVNGTGSATLLNDPLWYAAKWGSFTDDNGNSLPDSTEWDADGNGTPDNYFLVTNPLKLETQLTKALSNIKNNAATAAATSTNSFSYQSDSMLYQARFSNDGWTGELNAYPIQSDGSLGSPAWQAQYVLANTTTRKILTYDPDATTKGIPFQWSSMSTNLTLQNSLNKNYQGTVDSNGSSRVSYLRGAAVTGMRTRPYIKGTAITNELGDIVSSQPQYVGMPNFGYPESTYASFRNDYQTRTTMLYVGANDGMLHGFSASDGTEKIAYVPSEMYRIRNSQPLLSKLTDSTYGKSGNAHNYYVDGTPTVGDVCTATCTAKTDWKTILVGGLNGGGQGIYALNVTNPANFSEDNASSLVMWEFNDKNDTDSDATMQYGLGYTYSRPAIVRICTNRDNSSSSTPKACTAGKWVVIFGNGYNNTEADGYASTSGYAILYVLDALTGQVIKKISTKAGSASSPNGLSTPAAIDIDNDNYVDYVYAGDLQGNLWKFNLTSDTASNWSVAYGSASSPSPLYVAKDSDTNGNRQPITTAPDVILNTAITSSSTNVVVTFGTGSYLTTTDSGSTSVQSVYGILDDGSHTVSGRSSLVQQTIGTTTATSNGNAYRSISSASVDWSSKKGWYVDLPSSGERIAYDPRIIGSVLAFTSTIPNASTDPSDPCQGIGSGWDYYVDALTGSRLSYPVFDGVGTLDFGTNGTVNASGRQSNVGIIPDGTIITQGKGRGTDITCGSTGDCDSYKVNLGTNIASRISWREIITD